MASKNPLSTQIDAIENKANAIESAFRWALLSRIGIMLLLIIVIATYSFKLYNFGLQFADEAKQEEFLKEAEKQFFGGKDMQAALEENVQQLADNAVKTVEKAFRAQMDADMSLYAAALRDQRELLSTELEVELNRVVDARMEELLNQHEQILQEKFKDRSEFSEEQLGRMIRGFDVAMEKLIEEYYVKQIRAELDQLFASYDEFPVSGPIPEGERARILIQRMSQVLSLKLARGPGIIDAAPAATEDATEPEEEGDAPAADPAAENDSTGS